MKAKFRANQLTQTAQAVRALVVQAGVVAMWVGIAPQAVFAQGTAPAPASTQTQPQSTAATRPSLGARMWITEDPALLVPTLSVSSPDKVALVRGVINEKILFNVYTNYAAFMQRAEVRVFAPGDIDRIKPIALIPVSLSTQTNQVNVDWDSAAAPELRGKLREGDQLTYVLRAYDAQGNWDETRAGVIELVSNVEKARVLEAVRQSAGLGAQRQSQAAGITLERFLLATSNFGQSAIAIQNMVLRGSKVRVRGQNLALGAQVTINGQSVPVDDERKFVAEYLLPVGQYTFEVEVKDDQGQVYKSQLQTAVRGEYWFLVGLADLTLSKNSYNGKIDAVTESDYERFSRSHTDGRLAFYLKGKIQGRYLLTAQADTLEKEGKDLFKNFFKADRADVLRRIDPDAYYPIYGDDSVAVRDVDTAGRLYVRLDWDKNSAVWGNVNTEFNANELAAYNRSLYGARLVYRSPGSAPQGEPRSQLKAFAADQQTASGRTEFLGTGGSLYYLRNTDVVRNSENVVLEMRDKDSGRVLRTAELKAGRDFEIDYFQGRIILSRPLSQITRESSPLQDKPLDGQLNVLVASYEFYPQTLDSNNSSVGVTGRQWIGDNLAIGGTLVREQRAGQDYELKGVDVTLQKGQGTWLKLEHALSKSSLPSKFFSTDGGLSFQEQSVINPNLKPSTSLSSSTNIEGRADTIEARLNAREMGWTERNWSAGAWWRRKDAGFSSEHASALGSDQTDAGIEVTGEIGPNLQLLAGHKKVQTSTDSLQTDSAGVSSLATTTSDLQRTQVGLQWNLDDEWIVNAETQRLKTVDNDGKSGDKLSQANLAGLRVTRRLWKKWDVYAGVQASFGEKNYDSNSGYSLGTKYAFDNLSSLGLDYFNGDRGSALTASGEYRRTPDHTLYSSYTHSLGGSGNAAVAGNGSLADGIFNRTTGWTVGQRWQLSPQWRLTNEYQRIDDQNGQGNSNSLGLEFSPSSGWSFGGAVQKGELVNTSNATVDRQAISVSGRYTDAKIDWSSKLEHRLDKIGSAEGAASSSNSEQVQWLTANRLTYKLSDDWRALGKFNYSRTNSQGLAAVGGDMVDAKLIDTSLGFAWRPRQGRLNLLAKYNYLYDLAPLGQLSTTGSEFDQRSHIFGVEGTYRLSRSWELAAKLAYRKTQQRLERGQGQWFSNDATYAAAQARWYLGGAGSEGQDSDAMWNQWSLLGEYRMLRTQQDGVKSGALIAVEKDVNKNLRLGLGYNFTDFSSDLSQLSFKSKGWFFNVVGRFGESY